MPTNARAAGARENCEALWRDFHDLADKNFVDRFPFEFVQRWFELYLGATLRNAGLDVTAPKPGPDFLVTHDGRRIFIEAITPKPGDPLHADVVHEPVYVDADGQPIAVGVPHDQITLRLASAFRSKADKFDRYRRQGLVTDDDSCVIAINLRAIPQAWADAEDFWFRSLYGVGNRFLQIDRGGGATIAGREYRSQLHRAGGAAEDVAPLLGQQHAGIAGVLRSSAGTGNLPTLLGDDFTLMPHAFAQSPCSRGLIRRGIEILLNADQAGGWNVERIDYGAHPPRGPEQFSLTLQGKVYEVEWAVEGRNLSIRVGSRGIDQPIAAGADPAAAAHDVAIEIARGLAADDAL